MTVVWKQQLTWGHRVANREKKVTETEFIIWNDQFTEEHYDISTETFQCEMVLDSSTTWGFSHHWELSKFSIDFPLYILLLNLIFTQQWNQVFRKKSYNVGYILIDLEKGETINCKTKNIKNTVICFKEEVGILTVNTN